MKLIQFLSLQLEPYRHGFDDWNVEVLEEPQSKSIRLQSCAETTKNFDRLNNESNKENFSLNSTGKNPPYVSPNIQLPDQSIAIISANTNTNIRQTETRSNETSENEFVENCHKSILFSGKYFTVVSKKGTSIIAKCSTCQNRYAGSISTTSNFITHLKVKQLTFLSY